jgi:hypothetical protein
MGTVGLGFECKPRLKNKWAIAGRDTAKAEHGPSYGAASVPSKVIRGRRLTGSCVIRPLLRPPDVIMTAANSPASKKIVTAALLVIGGRLSPMAVSHLYEIAHCNQSVSSEAPAQR